MTTKTLIDKDEIVRLAKEYLKKKENNSLVDLTGFISERCPDTHTHSAFVRDIANKMRRTGDHEIIEQENGQRFLVYPLPKKPFRERYWFLIAVVAFLIGLVTPSIQRAIEEKIYPADKQIEGKGQQIEDRPKTNLPPKDLSVPKSEK